MANNDIREIARKKRIAQWEIAEALGLNESVFSRKMRHELSQKEKDMIMAIIDDLANVGADDAIDLDDDEDYSEEEIRYDMAVDFLLMLTDSCVIVDDEKFNRHIKTINDKWGLDLLECSKGAKDNCIYLSGDNIDLKELLEGEEK